MAAEATTGQDLGDGDEHRMVSCAGGGHVSRKIDSPRGQFLLRMVLTVAELEKKSWAGQAKRSTFFFSLNHATSHYSLDLLCVAFPMLCKFEQQIQYAIAEPSLHRATKLLTKNLGKES